MPKNWQDEKSTGRELVEQWVDDQPSIAEAARILGLGPAGRQRLWAYLRVGTGLGDMDELRAARILRVPYEAIAIADTPVCDLFAPRLGDKYVGEDLSE
jgi:hypothetical protein